MEALSDALRVEVVPFGVKVSLIEPGLIRTSFGDTAAHTLAGSATPTGPYATLNTAVGVFLIVAACVLVGGWVGLIGIVVTAVVLIGFSVTRL
ncbi:hypothetical protein [Streptomyces sp. BR123]|uniref:hypothetical protein n=1 Tax=Streptomyces sp. BR123 TaxID=2749828 RepID=UPI00211B6A72|nr:hypothetical protein [Streptomyces sp. BR123]